MSNARAAPFDCSGRRSVRHALRKGASRAAAILRGTLPQHCELCAAPADGLLCAPCVADLPRVGAACPRCALPSTGDGICGACISHPPPHAATVAAFVYAFPVDRLVQRIKYGGSIALARWAGEALADAVHARLSASTASDRPHAIVALPLAAARQRERGFNQAGEIAARVARAITLPMAAPLTRTAGGVPQTALPWAARRNNVRGAFAVHGAVREMRIALVDDVMTTGATLAEASGALIAAGAARVDCWVVARTLPPARA